jgi:putative endonuclease
VDVEDVGRLGERIAADYLSLAGCVVIRRNYRGGRREIDLIVRDGGCIAFVEVKTRTSDAFGSAREAINRVKFAHLRSAARRFISDFRGSCAEFRFDLVAIDIDTAGGTMVLRHIKGIGQF